MSTTSSSMPSFPSMLSWSRDESTQRVKYFFPRVASCPLVVFLSPPIDPLHGAAPSVPSFFQHHEGCFPSSPSSSPSPSQLPNSFIHDAHTFLPPSLSALQPLDLQSTLWADPRLLAETEGRPLLSHG